VGVLVVIAGVAVFALRSSLGLFQSARPDLLTHTVQYEFLPVTVVERGTLESAENREVVCQVKAGARGTFASSIKDVIPDGTPVIKGQWLMDLDDSALREQEQQQYITLLKAKSAKVKAKEDLDIQVKTNASDIASKFAALEVAEIALEKYLGVLRAPDRDPLGAVAGGPATLAEKGEFRMKLDDLSGQLKLAESDLEAYRDRSSWAERASRSGYLTPSQAKVELSKLESSLDKVEKLQKEKFALETYTRRMELTDLQSKVKVALAGYEQAILQAEAKNVQMGAELETADAVYAAEMKKMEDIQKQLDACTIKAPQNGLVVYYKDQNNRFGNSNEGMIQIGAQVKEGQKLLRIPNLQKMQVTAKIHEALVSRIRADVRVPTGVFDSLRAGMLANPHAFSRLVSQSEWALERLREEVRDQEYRVALEGQPATVRVDAFPERVFKGRVRSRAAVAAQADWSSSDVKLFPTVVSIDDTDVTGLMPDMSAEVTIHVDAAPEKVLTIPMQAVIGGADMGSKRKVFVLAGGQPQEREVTLGTFNDKKVEVRDGLSEGDVVVINPKVLLGDKAKGTREEGDASGRGAGGGNKAGMPGGGMKGKGGGGGGGNKAGVPGGGAPQGGGGGGRPPSGGGGGGGLPQK
jgi:HlyD family secretion protein